jgi:predicted transcriptional regulator of viral defense system
MAATGAPDLADWLLSHGRTSVTTEEVASLLGIPRDHVRVRLNQPVADHQLFSPGRGLWIPIPAEYRTWGATPATHFLDDFLRHLERKYYIGWLSAAELHGAAHQRPQVTQVAVNQTVANREVGRNRLVFYERSSLTNLPRLKLRVPTGEVWVSTRELTAVDLVDRPERGAGISNVATVLSELAHDPRLSGDLLARAAKEFPSGTARRLGYLLDLLKADVDLTPLRRLIATRPLARPAMLTPQGPRRGEQDANWGLLLNTVVEPDL